MKALKFTVCLLSVMAVSVGVAQAQDRVGPVLLPKFTPLEICKTLGLCAGRSWNEVEVKNWVARMPNDGGGFIVLTDGNAMGAHVCRSPGSGVAYATNKARKIMHTGCWATYGNDAIAITWAGRKKPMLFGVEEFALNNAAVRR